MATISPNIELIRAEVRRRRKELKLSYRTVVSRAVHYLYDQECDEAEITVVSEDWLKRFELERSASLTANILNALLRALTYSDRDRIKWLLHAGYSPMAVSTSALTEAEEALNYATHVLRQNPVAVGLIASFVANGQAASRTDDELLEVVANAYGMALKYRRRQ